MTVLLLDNYDSFTYNLAQALGALGAAVVVRRNDAITLAEVRDLQPTHLVVSPGPGRPEEAGSTLQIMDGMVGRVPILGVCLGHQALARVFGGQVDRADQVVHGKASLVYHDGRGIYTGLPSPLSAGRYHSLVVAAEGLPGELAVAAFTSDGVVMGLRHRTLPIEGVQFHPESMLTPAGPRLLRNFLGGAR